ncbi:MAG: T9SS type A sorting domain-containing protein [Ignavibacteriaceae bacterium]|nr:T9SS type A sorting domain-containing protein [Ignavibacteriaceae bacterium]MCW9095882.1 T9SS type A sorting domain-containing protein [Ignavibacteriaceae bacterium]
MEFTASNLSSGIYFYRLESQKFVSVKKMIIIK